MRYEVTLRGIHPDGSWEEWAVTAESVDETGALAKVLRRKGFAGWLLEDGLRFRFSVSAA